MLAPGSVVGGLTVQRVAGAPCGPWTLAEATAGEDVPPVTLCATPAGPGARRLLEGLTKLRLAPDGPLVTPQAGEADGLLYLVRTPPPGATLADRLREGPLAPDEAVRLLSQVAGALETLALLGVPHGPLRPDRIALTARRPPQAQLWDIGIAEVPAPACAREDLLDQVAYLAPEAARGAPDDPAVTVYALGCILFECLTGAPPFRGPRALLVLDAHAGQAPPRVSDHAKVPPALDRVVATALSKFPAQRQRTPAAFLRAVQRALDCRAAIPVLKPQPLADDERAPVAPTPKPAAAKPARKAAQAPKAAPERTAARKARRRAPADPPRRRRRRPWSVSAGVAIGATMLVASTAGFATAQLNTDTTATPPSATAAAVSGAPASAARRAAYVRGVDRAMQRLGARRAMARHRLRTARQARAQAGAAVALSRLYAEAARTLPAAPRGTDAAIGLQADLRSTAEAYRGLAFAAWRRNAAQFRAAGRNIVANEAAVQEDLRRLVTRTA